MTRSTAAQRAAALHLYHTAILAMQGHTFYCEDENGILRRWTPPRPSKWGGPTETNPAQPEQTPLTKPQKPV